MIRPIEMQMLLPRTESVGTTQQQENQKVVNDNTYAANEVAKEVQVHSDTVIKKDPNEFTEYQYDAREEGKGTYQKPGKKRRNKKEDNPEEPEGEALHGQRENQPRINIQI